MTIRVGLRIVLALALGVAAARPAAAQIYESVGTRAQGLGGAFVAVADDATASWWNPAGLATGAYFNVVLERGRTTEPAEPDETGGSPARRVSSGGFSAAFPALGLSYYRLRASEIGVPASTAAPGDGRQDQRAGATAGLIRFGQFRAIRYSQYGATVGQSIGDHFVVGSTVKVIRAGAESRITVGEDHLFDAADDLDVAVKTRTGLDLGAMASFNRLRVGLSVRNVHELNVGTDDDPFILARQARAGVAVLGGKHGVLEAVTVAADADLTTAAGLFGDTRHVATGAEAWLFARRLGVRGGGSVNSIGERRPSGSVGVSVAPLSGFFVEAAWTEGRDASLRGWTTSLRVTF